MRGVARTAVVAGTATAVSNRVSRRQANRWAAQEQPQQQYQEPYPQQQPRYEDQAQYAPPPAPAAPAANDMDAKISQLKQLAALKTQGVLSEAEFEAEKAKLLA
jgi:hypothetical protein